MQQVKRSGRILTAIAFVIAVIFGILAFTYFNNLERAIGDVVPVVVALQDIPARTLIRSDLVEEVEIPRKFVHDSYFFSVQDLAIGYVAMVDIQAGQIIQRNMVDANAGLDPGFRAVAIAADQVANVGGNVRPGNRVDVVVSFGETESTNQQTRVLLQDVKVLAVNSLLPAGGEDLPSGIGTNRFLPTGQLIKDSIITLALKPEDAIRLTYVANFGSEVRLMIRRLDEPADSRPVEPVRQEDIEQ